MTVRGAPDRAAVIHSHPAAAHREVGAPGAPVAVPPPATPPPAPSTSPTRADDFSGAPRILPALEPLISDDVRGLLDGFRSKLVDAARRWPTRPNESVIVIAARNEEESIGPLLDNLHQVLDTKAERRNTTVAFHLNACTDDSAGALRRWVAAHPDAELLELAPGTPCPPNDDGRLRIVLHHVPEPGKLRALSETATLFDWMGGMPERVVQMDADTRLSPGDLRGLAQRLHDEGMAAVGGAVRYVDADGRAPDIQSLLHNQTVGEDCRRVLAGPLVTSRADVFVAAHLALQEHTPGVMGEDLAYTCIVRALGLKTAVAVDFPVETRAAEGKAQSKKQRWRWMSNTSDWRAFFGKEAMACVGLDPSIKQVATTFARNTLLGPAPLREKARDVRMAVAQGPKIVADRVKADRAAGQSDMSTPAQWEPPRPEQPQSSLTVFEGAVDWTGTRERVQASVFPDVTAEELTQRELTVVSKAALGGARAKKICEDTEGVRYLLKPRAKDGVAGEEEQDFAYRLRRRVGEPTIPSAIVQLEVDGVHTDGTLLPLIEHDGVLPSDPREWTEPQRAQVLRDAVWARWLWQPDTHRKQHMQVSIGDDVPAHTVNLDWDQALRVGPPKVREARANAVSRHEMENWWKQPTAEVHLYRLHVRGDDGPVDLRPLLVAAQEIASLTEADIREDLERSGVMAKFEQKGGHRGFATADELVSFLVETKETLVPLYEKFIQEQDEERARRLAGGTTMSDRARGFHDRRMAAQQTFWESRTGINMFKGAMHVLNTGRAVQEKVMGIKGSGEEGS